jgi:hypothetical protein
MTTADGPAPVRGAHRLRVLVAALVGLEALLLMLAAVTLLVAVVTGEEVNVPGLVFLAVIGLAFGAALGFCARGVLAARPWTRGPVLTWQLLQAGVAMPLSTSGAWWAGAPLLAVAVVTGVLIAGQKVVPRPDRFAAG